MKGLRPGTSLFDTETVLLKLGNARTTFKEFKSICDDDFLENLSEYWSKKGAKKFNEFRDTIDFPITANDVETKRNKQTAKEIKKNRTEATFKQLIGEDLCGWIEKGFANYSYTPPKLGLIKKKEVLNREVTLFISDTHFGSDLKANECPMAYGKVEEARRLAKVIQETVNYKRQYRKNTKLNILLGGDIIDGSLHDARTGAPVREQMARAMWLLEKAIKVCASEFPQVDVYCTTGNHGRDKVRHKDRGVDQKWDSNETAIYYGVYLATKNLSNVRYHLPLTPYVNVPIQDTHLFLTHGDTVLNVGYPGNSINVKSLETQIHKINSGKPEGVEYSLFAIGHVHIASVVRLAGKVLITNGALVPPDPYAQSLGSMAMSNGQTLWESVPGYPFGDHRFIEVNGHTDKDSSLDSIIPAWPGFP